MNLLHELSRSFSSAAATLLMDVWLILLKRLGVQTLNFAFIGWVAHLSRGRVAGMRRSARRRPCGMSWRWAG